VYRWTDHTAEVELEIEAPSEREVLADSIKALAELLGIGIEGPPRMGEPEQRTLHLGARDRPTLLAAWLEELVFLAESEGFVATGIEQLALGNRELTATVVGIRDEPPPLVKAVTYHRLLFEPSERGYRARVVLDV
jgi:SHS2 domain-containing protein